jgi:hypothetical protein
MADSISEVARQVHEDGCAKDAYAPFRLHEDIELSLRGDKPNLNGVIREMLKGGNLKIVPNEFDSSVLPVYEGYSQKFEVQKCDGDSAGAKIGIQSSAQLKIRDREQKMEISVDGHNLKEMLEVVRNQAPIDFSARVLEKLPASDHDLASSFLNITKGVDLYKEISGPTRTVTDRFRILAQQMLKDSAQATRIVNAFNDSSPEPVMELVNGDQLQVEYDKSSHKTVLFGADGNVTYPELKQPYQTYHVNRIGTDLGFSWDRLAFDAMTAKHK